MKNTPSTCTAKLHQRAEDLIALMGAPLSEVDKTFAIRGNFKQLTTPVFPQARPTPQPKFAH